METKMSKIMLCFITALFVSAVQPAQAQDYVPDFKAAQMTLSKGTIENLFDGATYAAERCASRPDRHYCATQAFEHVFKMLQDAALITKDPRDLDAVASCSWFTRVPDFRNAVRCVGEKVDPSRKGYGRAVE
jgi:hypothetical protein